MQYQFTTNIVDVPRQKNVDNHIKPRDRATTFSHMSMWHFNQTDNTIKPKASRAIHLGRGKGGRGILQNTTVHQETKHIKEHL